MRFQKGMEKVAGSGRKKGVKNKRQALPNELTHTVIEKVTNAAKNNEQWALLAVLDRTVPKAKPTALPHTVEYREIEARLNDLADAIDQINELMTLVKK